MRILIFNYVDLEVIMNKWIKCYEIDPRSRLFILHNAKECEMNTMEWMKSILAPKSPEMKNKSRKCVMQSDHFKPDSGFSNGGGGGGVQMIMCV